MLKQILFQLLTHGIVDYRIVYRYDPKEKY